MKIKVATTFSYRSDSRDGQSGERFISSALTIEPDEDIPMEEIDATYEADAQFIGYRSQTEALFGTEGTQIGEGVSDCADRRKQFDIGTGKLDAPELKSPRFMVIGKPCTGKTTLSRQLCKQYGCELVNATDLIEENLRKNTEIGQKINHLLVDGRDLEDEIVLDMLKDKLKSPSCIKHGYVLDGIPTHSEHTLSIESQLDFIFSLENPPTYLIDIQISNSDLRTRWEDMRIDHMDGKIYPRESYEAENSSPRLKYVGHPDFPQVDAATKERLLTRYEELSENLDQHFHFYDSHVQNKVENFMSKYDPWAIINVDGRVTPSERLEETIEKLKRLSNRQSHESFESASECQSKKVPTHPLNNGVAASTSFVVDKSLWLDHPPRLVLFGKPCAGKTTLAKALCQSWDCQYINATELILHHINNRTEKGKEIIAIMSRGEDLTDDFVLGLLREPLSSPECRQTGFILDGIPTFSEKAMPLDAQMKFLEHLYPEPYFWVELDISDEELHKRWETVRIDHDTGNLYTKPNYEANAMQSELSCNFPTVDEAVKDRLLTRCEELPENLEAHFEFYNSQVSKLMSDFLNRCQSTNVIQLDGSLCPSAVVESLIDELRTRIEKYGLRPAPIASSLPSDTVTQQPVKPTTTDSSTGHLTSPNKKTELTSPRSSQSSCMSDYRGTVGDFRVRSLRSTGSISSQSSAGEPPKMSELLKLANITCVSTDPCSLATAQSASLKPAGFSLSMPDTGHSSESRVPYGAFSKPPCCCQCGEKLAEISAQLWRNKPPRFLIFGKPCTGKTALAKKMCSEWGCRLVNGTELILRHMAANDDYGKRIKELMNSGKDLEDSLMIEIVANELNSPECMRNGFVIDDFPNYSEKSLSVQKQLDFLFSLQPGLEYVIELQMPDDILKARWESVKVDLESGILYVGWDREPRSGLAPSCCMNTGLKSRKTRPPTSAQLITRFEELAESMENNITFYHEVVEPQLRNWVEKYYANVTIPMDADMTLDEIFYVLQRKMQMVLDNPAVPPKQLFTDKENSFLPGSCCLRCGARYSNLEPQVDLWPDNPPRILILGKPCTGKTTLAKRLCAQWNCQLINATDIMQQHLALNTATGKRIRSMLSSGQDLPDHFVINMLLEKLNSPGCTEAGYVLDGIPTHSEKSQSIVAQIDFLRSLDPPPDYVILIEISDAALRERWQSIRIDVADGALYASRMFGNVGYHLGKPTGRRTRHPDFPQLDDETRNRLITRHEELPENLDKHFVFYNTYIAPQVQRLVGQHDPSKIIVLDGEHSSIKMMNSLLYKLNVMARNPNVPTAQLFAKSSTKSSDGDVSCVCQRRGSVHLEPMAELWLDSPPRVILVGKPCTGKSTLAKRLCVAWGCQLIDASEIIQHELDSDSETGRLIRDRLTAGHDLEDQFVLDLIRQAVCSPVAKERGYILIGIPTHSEMTMSVDDQLTFLRGLENGPDYIIEIQMNDEQLRDRWEAIRIDLADGALYSKLSYDRNSATGSGRRTRHPDFPVIDEATKKRLLTRHEELPENLNLHFEFFHRKVEAPLQMYIAKHDPSKVVRVNGNVSPSELLQAVLIRMSLMAQHPGVDTTTLFPKSDEELEDTDCTCQCQRGDAQEFSSGLLWNNGVPRVMIVGNSCSGKSTLAKRLARDWNCLWINASDLVIHHLNNRTALGDQIFNLLLDGKDLCDNLVLRMLEEKLQSPECTEKGYILDDFPTSSEKGMPISKQLEMLSALPNRPDYIINIVMPEDALRKRWQSVRIDLADGLLYPDARLSITNASGIVHPNFPTPTGIPRQRLITRHEDLCENIEKQSRFYTEYVEPHIMQFIQQYEGDNVITVDGTRSHAEVYKTIHDALLRKNKVNAAN